MNKNLLIGGGIVVLILSGFFVFRMISSGEIAEEEITPTPTPTPAYQEVDDSVEAEITMQPNGKNVDITITGLDGRFESMEYELSYDTDKGPKGVIGKMPLKAGQDSVEREERLGTCSTGGKCTDHTGVENFKLVVKFYTADDEVFILEKDFEEV
ncbi:MAG: hypothetical protein UU81_C0002G0033 [Microgenomates group bacterium GW2011_GWC1_41_8]|nr:MAG: hypothetical protein UT85_C0001G0015 [Candidatus Levybacteria bacterium GW2011_GWA2_40_16]KKR72583.1 MAG: hypothetical protein UU14_C0004G0014 [Candidatus Roizmanbacteria bacterium GW2011_GWB1_40_7]KKR95024.1 MAG: hypothetical protein UU41_C0001G0014 [Candidatus Roizmanbacteria bacterium GW2011_GWA1_41_13]KKS24778.1 MAG: hypothetical protein UU81_C0002G0033 [Microgenomates group bacterium GW2011_GWC1_41_8]OGK49065.1 MAG: hypothetical protein A3A55_00075 [Candidatus Roizmanbacteria bacte